MKSTCECSIRRIETRAAVNNETCEGSEQADSTLQYVPIRELTAMLGYPPHVCEHVSANVRRRESIYANTVLGIELSANEFNLGRKRPVHLGLGAKVDTKSTA